MKNYKIQRQLRIKSKLTKNSINQLPFKIQKSDNSKIVYYQKKGHWTEKEKLKYSFFVSYFRPKFQIKQDRRNFKIFKVMADFVKTRSHNQCRSHHQKMQKQYLQLDTIIQNVAEKYHPRTYQTLYQKHLSQIQNLDQFYFYTKGQAVLGQNQRNIKNKKERSPSVSQKDVNCLIIDCKSNILQKVPDYNGINKGKQNKTSQSYAKIQNQEQEQYGSQPFTFFIPQKQQNNARYQCRFATVGFQPVPKNINEQNFSEQGKDAQLLKIQIGKAKILQNYKMHCWFVEYYQHQFWDYQNRRLTIMQKWSRAPNDINQKKEA